MATPVGITMKAMMGDFVVEVSITANSVIGPGQPVLAEHQRRVSRAMAVLLTDSPRGIDDFDPSFDER